MSMPTKPNFNAASNTQTASGTNRRGFMLTAAAAVSSTLIHSDVSRAAIVQTDTAKLPPLPLPSVQLAAGYTVQALPIPGTALYGEANDINDAGEMAGWHSNGNVWSAVKWDPTGTRMTDLGTKSTRE